MTSTASFRHMIYAQRWKPAGNLQKARRDNTCRYMKSCTASNNNSSADFNRLLKKEQLTDLWKIAKVVALRKRVNSHNSIEHSIHSYGVLTSTPLETERHLNKQQNTDY